MPAQRKTARELAVAEITPRQESFAAWLEAQTGVPIERRTAALAFSLLRDFRVDLKAERELAAAEAKRKAHEAKLARIAKLRAELERLEAGDELSSSTTELTVERHLHSVPAPVEPEIEPEDAPLPEGETTDAFIVSEEEPKFEDFYIDPADDDDDF